MKLKAIKVTLKCRKVTLKCRKVTLKCAEVRILGEDVSGQNSPVKSIVTAVTPFLPNLRHFVTSAHFRKTLKCRKKACKTIAKTQFASLLHFISLYEVYCKKKYIYIRKWGKLAGAGEYRKPKWRSDANCKNSLNLMAVK